MNGGGCNLIEMSSLSCKPRRAAARARARARTRVRARARPRPPRRRPRGATSLMHLLGDVPPLNINLYALMFRVNVM